MEALNNMVRQNITAASSNNGLQAQAPAPVPDNSYNVPMTHNGSYQQQTLPVTHSQPAYPFQAAPPPHVNASAMSYAYPPQPPIHGQAPAFPASASNQPRLFPGVVPIPPPAAGIDPAVANQLQLIKLLVDQGVPEHTIPALLATMQNGFPTIPPAAVPLPPQPGQVAYSNSWGQAGARPDESRDHHDYDARTQDRYAKRSRSRSPPRHWESRDSPRGRNERRYDSHGNDSPGRGNDRGWGAKYRDRSPTPPSYDRPSTAQKWFTFDESIPKGHIKGMPPKFQPDLPDTNTVHSSQQNPICRWCDVSFFSHCCVR
jgi:protein NRD1